MNFRRQKATQKFQLLLVLLLLSVVGNAQIKLDSGLVGHFTLDGNANDLSPVSVHGVVNNATLTTGITNNIDSAYYFNGTDASINFDTTNRGISSVVTISAWVKTTSLGLQWVIGKYDWAVDKGYQLIVYDGHPVIAGRNNSGQYIATHYNNPKVLVNDGKWHFLLAEISDNDWSVWVDCVLDTTVVSTSTMPNLANTTPLTMGYYFAGSNGDHLYFDGAIDEVRLYNRTITTDEKQKLCEQRSDSNAFLAPQVSNDTTVCDSVSLTLFAQADSGMVFWESPLGTIVDSGNTHTATITQKTTFYVYSFSNGVYSDTAIIQVDTMFCGVVYPPPSISDTVVCIGEQFNVIFHPDSGIVHWESSIGTLLTTGDTLPVTATSNQQFFTYTVYNTGVSDTVDFNVDTMSCGSSIPPPIAPSGDSICTDTSITFQAQSDTGVVYWLDSSGSILDTGITYTTIVVQSETYYLYTDVNGVSSDTVSFQIIAKDCKEPVFPNVFTPNGDGVNDYLNFIIPNVTCFDLVIYNRWAVEVFKSENIGFEWDGRIISTGKPVANGVYYYILTYCVKGKGPETKSGTVTIFR